MFKHQQDLDAVAQDLQAARDMVEAGDLQGATADRLFDAMTDNTDNAKTLADAVKALVEALGALADALTSTGLWFDNLADAAVAEHLEVTEDEIVAPADPTNPAYDAQVEACSQFCEESYEIYEKERKAYEDFESACQDIAGHSHGSPERSFPTGRSLESGSSWASSTMSTSPSCGEPSGPRTRASPPGGRKGPLTPPARRSAGS